MEESSGRIYVCVGSGGRRRCRPHNPSRMRWPERSRRPGGLLFRGGRDVRLARRSHRMSKAVRRGLSIDLGESVVETVVTL